MQNTFFHLKSTSRRTQHYTSRKTAMFEVKTIYMSEKRLSVFQANPIKKLQSTTNTVGSNLTDQGAQHYCTHRDTKTIRSWVILRDDFFSLSAYEP